MYNTSTPDMILFSQTSSGNLHKSTARADMSVDPTTCALTIGRVQLEDGGYFTCRVLDKINLPRIYHQTNIKVYSKFTVLVFILY